MSVIQHLAVDSDDHDGGNGDVGKEGGGQGLRLVATAPAAGGGWWWRGRTIKTIPLNSLTAMDGHDCPLNNELHC
jgi:hypothetical protein